MNKNKKIYFGLVFIVILSFLVFVATRQSNFKIMKFVYIHSLAPNVFNQINDFNNWGYWNAVAVDSLKNKSEVSKINSGVGAALSWFGDEKIGEGKIMIVETVAASSIKMKEIVKKPMNYEVDVEIKIRKDPDLTAVMWVIKGKRNFLDKLRNVLFSDEKKISMQLDEDLKNLKRSLESQK